MEFIITEVKIEICTQKNGLLGFASLVISNSIILTSIGIWKSDDTNGYRITYPTKGIKEREIYHPINKDMDLMILKSIIEKIKEVYV